MHNSFNGALLITVLWDQSHNFTDLLHDLRNVHLRLAIGTQHPRSSFLRTSVNSFPDSSTYCTSTRGTCTTAFAIKTVKLQQAVRNCIRSTCFGIVCTCLVDLRLSLSSVHHFGCECHDASTCCARITQLSPPSARYALDHMNQILSQQRISYRRSLTTSSYAFMACLSLWPRSGYSS